MKTLLSVLLVVLVIACGKPSSRCETNAGCFEGGKCVAGACAYACEEVGCLDGHFCDPDTNKCEVACPFACNPPDHSTPKCEATCGYTCQGGFYLDDLGACPACNVPEHCGPDCTPCTTPENGTATCNDACGVACNPGYHVDGVTCAPNTETLHCGASDEDCTASGGVTGMICKEGACVQNQRFSRNTSVPAQPTVRDIRDPNLPLVWQGCAAGLSGNDCAGTAATKNWDDANLYCTDLNTQNWGGYTTGWRLPTEDPTDPAIVDELSSILAATCPASPSQGTACIDNNAFPNTPADFFWSSSSSSSAPDPNYAWSVSFGYGFVNFYLKSSPYYVRCVRSGP